MKRVSQTAAQAPSYRVKFKREKKTSFKEFRATLRQELSAASKGGASTPSAVQLPSSVEASGPPAAEEGSAAGAVKSSKFACQDATPSSPDPLKGATRPLQKHVGDHASASGQPSPTDVAAVASKQDASGTTGVAILGESSSRSMMGGIPEPTIERLSKPLDPAEEKLRLANRMAGVNVAVLGLGAGGGRSPVPNERTRTQLLASLSQRRAGGSFSGVNSLMGSSSSLASSSCAAGAGAASSSGSSMMGAGVFNPKASAASSSGTGLSAETGQDESILAVVERMNRIGEILNNDTTKPPGGPLDFTIRQSGQVASICLSDRDSRRPLFIAVCV